MKPRNKIIKNHFNRKNFFYLLLLLIVVSCQNAHQHGVEYAFHHIEEKINPIIHSKHQEIIEIAEWTPFNWTMLHIFKPYTPIDEVYDTLGFIWEDAEKTHIHQSDSFNLLVFTKNDDVVKYIKWPRNKGDFSNIESSNYPYKSARFISKKEKSGGKDWMFLYAIKP